MRERGRLTFVTGGARSGKSRIAEGVARESAFPDSPVLYVATAEALDEEMALRVEEHRRRRPEGWRTLEARRGVGAALREARVEKGVVVVECLSLLVSNVLLDVEEGGEVREEVLASGVRRELDELLGWHEGSGCATILVSNEVGWGVVPPHRLGRLYRDALGRANQRVASRADDVIAVFSGLPLVLKGDPSLAPEDGRGG